MVVVQGHGEETTTHGGEGAVGFHVGCAREKVAHRCTSCPSSQPSDTSSSSIDGQPSPPVPCAWPKSARKSIGRSKYLSMHLQVRMASSPVPSVLEVSTSKSEYSWSGSVRPGMALHFALFGGAPHW